MIRRSTIVVILFGILIAGILGYDRYIRNQPPLEVTLVVDPLAEDWAKAAVEAFNQRGVVVNNGTARLRIRLDSTVGDTEIWLGETNWNIDRHPTLWLASSSASLSYLSANLPFQTIAPTTARTPLVWGGFQSYVNAITENGQRPFEWGAVNRALEAGTWANFGAASLRGNVFIALMPPDNSMGGVAALFSGVADLQQTNTLDRATINTAEVDAWLTLLSASLPSNVVGTPAQAMASQGGARINFALLPEVQWLTYLETLNQQERIVFAYPNAQFVLDFPLALWEDNRTTPIQREAAQAFANFLVSAEGQALAVAQGLRPIAAEPTTSDTRFSAAVPYGIVLTPEYGLGLIAPARSEVEVLLRGLQ
jgi:hypothetical protein